MDDLSLDVWWHIVTFLPRLRSILNVLSTSSYISRLLDDDNFWRNVAEIHHRYLGWNLSLIEEESGRLGWKEAVKSAIARGGNAMIKNIRVAEPTGDPDDCTHLMKVVIGESYVGKTSLLQRFINGTFGDYYATIGAAFLTKTLVSLNDRVSLQCWDLAGEERFRSLSPMYYRGAVAIIFAFDLASAESFRRVTQHWIPSTAQSIRSALQPHQLNAVLVGCKSDLTEQREVTFEEANGVAREFGWEYFETSSKRNEGVSEVFERVLERSMGRFRGLGGGGVEESESERREEVRDSEGWSLCPIL